jgi:hypothetical protein
MTLKPLLPWGKKDLFDLKIFLNPGKPRKTQENPGKPRKTQENPGKPRKTQENPGKPTSDYSGKLQFPIHCHSVSFLPLGFLF